MHQHNLLFLLSNMACNISCTIHMNPSCIKERISIELKRDPINVTSNHEVHKSVKISNSMTSVTHIEMQIILGISLTDDHSPQKFISSMVPSFTGAPKTFCNIKKHFKCINKINVHRSAR